MKTFCYISWPLATITNDYLCDTYCNCIALPLPCYKPIKNDEIYCILFCGWLKSTEMEMKALKLKKKLIFYTTFLFGIKLIILLAHKNLSKSIWAAKEKRKRQKRRHRKLFSKQRIFMWNFLTTNKFQWLWCKGCEFMWTGLKLVLLLISNRSNTSQVIYFTLVLFVSNFI